MQFITILLSILCAYIAYINNIFVYIVVYYIEIFYKLHSLAKWYGNKCHLQLYVSFSFSKCSRLHFSDSSMPLYVRLFCACHLLADAIHNRQSGSIMPEANSVQEWQRMTISSWKRTLHLVWQFSQHPEMVQILHLKLLMLSL
jgi:hypothetical protein